jgi:phosphohistidine phosphatase
MRTRPDYYYRQSAVIPYRPRSGGGVEILLITTRKRRRWIVPKGVVEPDLEPAESAVKEAFEEAGIRGSVAREPIGAFEYVKWGGTCRVSVFPMEVDEVLASWPEDFRGREWMTPDRAADRVREPDLRELILTMAR